MFGFFCCFEEEGEWAGGGVNGFGACARVKTSPDLRFWRAAPPVLLIASIVIHRGGRRLHRLCPKGVYGRVGGHRGDRHGKRIQPDAGGLCQRGNSLRRRPSDRLMVCRSFVVHVLLLFLLLLVLKKGGGGVPVLLSLIT